MCVYVGGVLFSNSQRPEEGIGSPIDSYRCFELPMWVLGTRLRSSGTFKMSEPSFQSPLIIFYSLL